MRTDHSIPPVSPPGPWVGRDFRIEFPRPALVMGVLNITPDSFSDGGRYLDLDRAIDHARRMVTEGAEIIDVGGESTRPNAEPVSEADELRRVIPVIERLRDEVKVLLSVDTQKPAVARAAVAAGAHIINDIAANRTEPWMGEIVAGTGCGYVAMHMQGTPQTMQREPVYEDVVREVNEFFLERLATLKAAGAAPEQVVLDVGIGFGKTLEHNLKLLAELGTFIKLQRPLLLGVSRKSLFGRLLGLEVDERLAPGIACAVWAVNNGVQLVRTHDVAPTVQALRMVAALMERKSV